MEYLYRHINPHLMFGLTKRNSYTCRETPPRLVLGGNFCPSKRATKRRQPDEEWCRVLQVGSFRSTLTWVA